VLDPASAAKKRDPLDSLLASRFQLRVLAPYDRALLGLGLLLVVDGLQDPRLGGDELTLGDTELKESDDDRGETICRAVSATATNERTRLTP
jgi:hypothetical protein